MSMPQPKDRTDHRSHVSSREPLADRLRRTLHAARGNSEIRRHLRRIVNDPEQIDPIVKELGPRHALVLDLFAISR